MSESEHIAKNIPGYELKPDTYLTNVSLAEFQREDDFAAAKLFPIIPVPTPQGKYSVFSKADLARDNMRPKPLFGKVQPFVMGMSDAQYSCTVEQLLCEVDLISALPYSRVGAQGSSDPRVAKVKSAVEQTKLHLDARFAESFFASGKWANELTGVSSNPGTSQFLKFSDASSDPAEVVDKVIMNIRREGRRRPNRIALGMETFVALRSNPAILDRIRYTGSAARPSLVSESVLAQLFGVDKVVVLASSRNKAGIGETADMEFVCDPKGMLICYAPDNPAPDEPSCGYTFAWDLLGDGQFISVSEYAGEPATHTEIIETLIAMDMKKTCDDLAVYLGSCV